MRSLLCLLFYLLGAADAAAASFDCAKAATSVEKAICDDPVLSKADERLAETFATALEETLDPQSLRAEERQWLLSRNKIKDMSALGGAYDDRIAALETTIGRWRAMPHEIDEAELAKRCIAFPDAPNDVACNVEESDAIKSQDDLFRYQLQSYNDNGIRIGGGVVVLEKVVDPKTAQSAARLRPVIAGYDETAHYERPTLTSSRVAQWLVVPGRLEGTGDVDAGLLYFFDPEHRAILRDVDTDAWQRELARRLPKGMAVWKGMHPDYAKMTVETPLWKKSDGNCCPTAGSATIVLGFKGQRLVVEQLAVRRGAVAASGEAPKRAGAPPVDDADRGTDLCGKSVTYQINAESFATGASAGDEAALATARDEAPILIHRALKALCARKTLTASEVAQRIDSVVLLRADGADNFTAYFPRDKAGPKVLATEWGWTGTEQPNAEDVSSGILCAFKPKLRLCQDRGP
ncbi:MAG TPA: hypothetical protein VLX85_16695 [Stellaceae bacterium]|nr:hypothetical protein [Stellaceae bacterium]